jgi:anti-anti-sigma factor
MTVDIDIITTRELVTLRCRGRLVLGDGAAALREAAARALSRGQTVALDLGRVTQMDAHGTGVLADLAGIARREGRALMLARVSDPVRSLLRLTRLDTVIPALSDAMAIRRAVPCPHPAVAIARV